MVKNHRLSANLSQKDKDALIRKSENYNSLTSFLEHIARHDIIIVDKNVARALRLLLENKKD